MAQQVAPRTAEELKDVVAWAAAEETPLEIQGAGSKRGFGRPVEAETLVALDGLSGIGLYEPAELVMSAKAGTPLAEIEELLAENQQQLAFEPPDYGALLGGAPGRATIGGVLACNLSGPRRIKAGAARDHFLGVQAVTGRGDLIKSGGRVVKNVTGYDLCKLFAGSFGTLAAMTEVTFKVLPAPEDARTLVLPAPDRTAAFAALRIAMASAYDVAGAAYLPAAAAGRAAVAMLRAAASDVALVRLEGQAPSVRYRADRLKALLGGERRDRGAAMRPTARRCGGRSATSRCCRKTPRCGGSRCRPQPVRRSSTRWSGSSSSTGSRTGRAGCCGFACAMATTAAPGRSGGAGGPRWSRDAGPRERRAARRRAGLSAPGAGACPPERAGQGELRSQAHPQSWPDVSGRVSRVLAVGGRRPCASRAGSDGSSPASR